MQTFLMVLLAVATLIATFLVKRLIGLYQVHKKIKHIPGVYQLFELFPISIPFFSTHYNLTSVEELEKACAMYGDKETQTLSIATSTTPLVFISDPKLLKEYFITKGHLFEKPAYDLVNYFGEDNIVTAVNNEKWKKHYKICAASFTPQNLMYVCKVADKSCDSLFEIWNDRMKETGSLILDVNEYSNLTLDILGKAAFNIDFGFYTNNEEGKVFRQSMEKLISPQAVLSFIFFAKIPFLRDLVNRLTGVQAATDHSSAYLDKIIEERKKLLTSGELLNTDESSDLLTLLVEANVKEETITNNQLKSNTLILATAGHETTAKSLSWISYRLSKNPEIQRKLWKEVDEVLQGRNPTYADIASLPYTNAIIMESLRLNPPVFHLGRIATKNLTLGKYEIPKGTMVQAFMKNVQQNEEIWENAKEFKPERFLDPKVKDNYQHNFTYAAFSLGNRQCLGKNFALLEAATILCKLAQNYEFKLLNDESVDPVGTFKLPVAKPTANMKVQVSRRK